jgi:hypothetical protein
VLEEKNSRLGADLVSHGTISAGLVGKNSTEWAVPGPYSLWKHFVKMLKTNGLNFVQPAANNGNPFALVQDVAAAS